MLKDQNVVPYVERQLKPLKERILKLENERKNKTPFEMFIVEVEKLEVKAGKQGAFNLVGKTTTAILKLAKEFQKLEK